MRTRVVEAEVHASHHQFYVVDERTEHSGGEVWDGQGLERHLGVADGMVAVGTIGYVFLPVALELWDDEPPVDVDGWDHVVEASLDVMSGRLGLHGVEGPAELEPLEVDPGTYRVRSSAAGLVGATEMDGGDRYRVQLWPAPAAAPEVLKWWAPWLPGGPEPTVDGGRVILGGAAHDRRVDMEWLATRGYEHLFRDADGVLWEHSTLQDASGTPQLEELDSDEAERRYGDARDWGTSATARPSLAQMLKNVWQTWRYSRGWRPPPQS